MSLQPVWRYYCSLGAYYLSNIEQMLHENDRFLKIEFRYGIFFHPSVIPYGGRKMEVKNPKNFILKVVLHPNTILKSHHFVVIWVDGHPTDITYSTLRYEKKIYTRHMSHMGACFWKWKIQKKIIRKLFSIQTRFWKVIILW